MRATDTSYMHGDGTVPDEEIDMGIKWLRKVTAAAAITVAIGVGGAAPASAAGSTAPDVTGCLRHGETNGAYASAPVRLLQWDQYRRIWVLSGRSGYTNSSGCTTFRDVAANQHYAIQAYRVLTSGRLQTTTTGATGYVYAASGYDPLYRTSTGYVWTTYAWL